jgi:hypothetical protein
VVKVKTKFVPEPILKMGAICGSEASVKTTNLHQVTSQKSESLNDTEVVV